MIKRKPRVHDATVCKILLLSGGGVFCKEFQIKQIEK
jgi:hypothetical protein